MKHLNKIIFINSASMRYEELELDGNIHLSGLSGAGKTSVERAILYFFTADQRNLGIDLNSQKTFVQHYFASSDSHIVYEVKKDDGAFCVILTNYENRIQYAFVDSAYRKEWIVDPVTRMVATSWSEITKNIPQHIDRDLVINIKDYNEIIWGCHRDHKYARYTLAESKGYDNLLKSLKNVFLNSGFSHDGLKTNIVRSMPDSSPSINLIQLRSRLQDYLNISGDLRKWYEIAPKGKKSVQEQAKDIIDIYYSYLEKIKMIHLTLCHLQYAVEYESKILPELNKRKQDNFSLVLQYTEDIKDIQQTFDNRKTDINGQIAILKEKLKKIDGLKEKYATINEIINEVASIPSVALELRSKEEVFQKLRNTNLSIEDKYKSMILVLKESYQKIVDEINKTEEERRIHSDENKANAEKSKDASLDKIESLYTERANTVNKSLDNLRNELLEISKSIARVEVTVFFAQEIQEKKDKITRLEKDISQTIADITLEKARYNTVKEEGLTKEKQINVEYVAYKEETEKEIEGLDIRLQEIDNILSCYNDSLYFWLQEQKDGWQSNIGKVIDESVLYRTDLHPALISDSADNGLYGVSLSLDRIEGQPFSPEDFEKERLSKKARVEGLRQGLREKAIEKEDAIKNNNEQYNKKLSSIKEQIAKLDLDNTTRSTRINRINETIQELVEKAKSEKEQQLAELHEKESKKNGEIKTKEQELERIKEEKQASIKSINTAYDDSVKKFTSDLNEFIRKCEAEKTAEKDKYDKEVASYENQKLQELAGKGVDTNRLSVLDNEVESLRKKLDNLNKKNIIVEKYKEDKKEYLDEEQNYILEQKRLELVISNIDKERNESVGKKQTDMNAAQAIVDDCDSKIENINKDLEEYNKRKSVYTGAFAVDGHIEPQETAASVGELMNDYRDLAETKNQSLSDLKRLINRFNGYFKANIFNLPQGLTIDDDYLKYSKSLNEIINHGAIDEYSIGQNGLYIKTLQGIRMQVDNLLKKKAAVDGIISELDRAFREASLPSVIQEIRLRRADIRDEMYESLLSIYHFVENNDSILPGVSLWVSQSEFDKVRTEMHELLSSFVNTLFKPGNNEREEFTLEDMFSIEFRVTENGQTYGWFSNMPKTIGSTGTSLMIKMLLNIMLISISKKKAVKKEEQFFLHCVLDESETLPPEYIRDILDFCTDKGIYLILGSPVTIDPVSFKRNYELYKDEKFRTRIQMLTERQEI